MTDPFLTPVQRTALHWMARKPLGYTVAGFCNDLRPGTYWHSQTIFALEKKGLCAIAGAGKKRVARITHAGRRELSGTIAGKVARP